MTASDLKLYHSAASPNSAWHPPFRCWLPSRDSLPPFVAEFPGSHIVDGAVGFFDATTVARAQHRYRIVDRGHRDRDGFISERPAARIVVVLAMPTKRTPGRSTSASVRISEAAVTM
jgi:hypothetical protein